MGFVLVATLLVTVVAGAVIGVGCSLFGWWL
jgi:mannose/fructose/N-acetylgalactosamine-specific phosphotransferase system component IIC